MLSLRVIDLHLIFRRAHLNSWRQAMFYIIGFHDCHCLSIVQAPSVVPVLVRVVLSVIKLRRVDAIDFPGVRLGELQEDDGPFGRDRVDDQCGQDDYQDRTEGQAEMTFMTVYVAVRMF